MHRLGGTAHKFVKVYTGHGNGKQTDSGKHGISAAYVIGNDKGLVALAVGKRLERAAGAVGGHEYTLCRACLTVLLLKQRAEHAECHRRLGGRAGL